MTKKDETLDVEAFFTDASDLAHRVLILLRDSTDRPSYAMAAMVLATGHMAQSLGMPKEVLVSGLMAAYNDSARADWEESGQREH